MSFRFYLGYIPKKDLKKMEKLSYSNLKQKFGKDGDFRPSDIAKELYGLGSRFEATILQNEISPLFINNETHTIVSTGENYFYKLTQSGFKAIIDLFHKGVLDGYKKDLSRLNSKDEFDKAMLKDSLQSKVNEWSNDQVCFIYNLDQKLDLTKECSLVTSWKYEYAIFELILKYKTFDWENNQLVIYGY